MTPAEMREAAAVLVADRPVRRMTWEEAVEARADLAAAIRALPLAEEAPPTDAADEAIVDALMARRTAGLATRPIRGERTVPLVDDVLELLPHLTGDELRRVAEAMPRVAGEWYAIEDQWVRDADDECGELAAVRDVGDTDPVWEAWTCVGAGDVESEHPTARAAQAACDARLEAAGVRLCGEVVRG